MKLTRTELVEMIKEELDKFMINEITDFETTHRVPGQPKKTRLETGEIVDAKLGKGYNPFSHFGAAAVEYAKNNPEEIALLALGAPGAATIATKGLGLLRHIPKIAKGSKALPKARKIGKVIRKTANIADDASGVEGVVSGIASELKPVT